MRRLQILRGQLQYKPELKDGEFFLDKTNHSLLIGDAAVADGQFELAKQSAITNLQQQVDTKITAAQAPVQSVNTKTGAVVLTAADVGALPDTTSIPTKTSELTNDSNFVDTTTLNSSLANKQNTITGGASTITDNNLTVSRALVSNGSGKVAVSTVTATELGYLDGVTSNIQTQLDNAKIPENDVILKQETKTITLPSSLNWESVTYGSGKFVTVASGPSTKATYSEDGITWAETIMPSSLNWESVTYGSGKFVAVASFSSKIAYSTDGIAWSETALPSPLNRPIDWHSVTYGNGKFVTVSSDSGYTAYSIDGITWTASTLPSSETWKSVTYGNGKFVTVANSSSKAAISTDGITWTETALPSSEVWKSVTYGNGKFVAVASDYPGKIVYSADGITWAEAALSSSLNPNGWSSVTYGDGKFVAMSSSTIAAYSTDGVTWTGTTMPSGKSTVIYGNGKFVAVASSSTRVAISTDGITWTETALTNALVNPSNTDITESVYSALEPYIPAPTVPTKTSELTNDSGFITQTDALPHATLVTLTVAGWNSTAKTQTVTVSGILADESKQLIIPMPATASMAAYNEAGIQCTGQAANSLTFTAETVPTAAISVYVTYQTVIS